jgi:tRNA-uridine 2-sulfurtransferase
MSGGVDSSVAAARLLAQGLDVVGVTLHLWDTPDDGSVRGRCCAPEDQHDARRVADHLRIPHFSFDRRATFLEEVIDPFVDAYLRGETPSPCVACNRGVKMRELFALADRLGARWVATGHYARVERSPAGTWLLSGRDRQKDQSYFLHALPPAELDRLLLPLGESLKGEVRAEAVELALPGATKGESQELCFIPHGRYDGFVEARAAGRVRPGPIVDDRGNTVGHHEGIHRFTVGQRKGVGVALGKPAFVTGIDAGSGTVRVGSVEALDTSIIEGDGATFAPGVSGVFSARVKVRARHEAAAAEVELREGGLLRVRFMEPVRAVTVGQYAVAYDGDRVLGGARISAVQGASA